jgi:hypothetical protein
MIHGNRSIPYRTFNVSPCKQRVVCGCIEITGAALELISFEMRLEREHGLWIERMMTASALLSGKQIVNTQSYAKLPFRKSRAAIHRPGELQRLDEIRRDSKKNLTLANGFANQSDFAALQISNSSVHQARRFAGGAARPVPLLDKRNAQPAHCRVARHSSASDSATDDEDVENTGFESGKRPRHSGKIPPPG